MQFSYTSLNNLGTEDEIKWVLSLLIINTMASSFALCQHVNLTLELKLPLVMVSSIVMSNGVLFYLMV